MTDIPIFQFFFLILNYHDFNTFLTSWDLKIKNALNTCDIKAWKLFMKRRQLAK